MPRSLFPMGQIVATPAALEALEDAGQGAQEFLVKHNTGDWGDWGDCDREDKEANEQALIHGSRIFSVYHTSKKVKIWVITEADRSSTCILLPDDY